MADDTVKRRGGWWVWFGVVLSLFVMLGFAACWYLVRTVPSLMSDARLVEVYTEKSLANDYSGMPAALERVFGEQSVYKEFDNRINRVGLEVMVNHAIDIGEDEVVMGLVFSIDRKEQLSLDVLERLIDEKLFGSAGYFFTAMSFREYEYDVHRLDRLLVRCIREGDDKLRESTTMELSLRLYFRYGSDPRYRERIDASHKLSRVSQRFGETMEEEEWIALAEGYELILDESEQWDETKIDELISGMGWMEAVKRKGRGWLDWLW